MYNKQLLEKTIKDNQTKTKEFGEVITPAFLINDMLNTLPSDVWSNPNLKWLDPCSGYGSFSAHIIDRLMDNLTMIPEELRYAHIINNMLYAVELQESNVKLYKEIFGQNSNIQQISFIDGDYTSDIKFDIIVMNPPYQYRKEGNLKSKAIWQLFIFESFKWLKEDGYLLPVHPSGWRNPEGIFKKVQDLLKTKQMIYLEVHNVKDGIKTFKCSTTYDFYLLKNTDNNGFETTIKCQDGTIERINIADYEFIPNGMFKEIFALIAKGW